VTWRETILATESCTESDVNELESHLTEEIDQLKTQSLTVRVVSVEQFGKMSLVLSVFGMVWSLLIPIVLAIMITKFRSPKTVGSE
jgi:hypothetical protein